LAYPIMTSFCYVACVACVALAGVEDVVFASSVVIVSAAAAAAAAGAAGFGGDAQYYGASGPSSTNGYLDAGAGQYAQPDNSYNPSQ